MSKYAKSLIAALLAGLGSLQVALDDNVITQSEWVKVAIATAAALGLVWGIPNAPKDAPEPDPVQVAAIPAPAVPTTDELPDDTPTVEAT